MCPFVCLSVFEKLILFDISDVFSKAIDAALTKIGTRVVSDKALLMMQSFMTFAKGQGHSDLLKMIKNAINDILNTISPTGTKPGMPLIFYKSFQELA